MIWDDHRRQSGPRQESRYLNTKERGASIASLSLLYLAPISVPRVRTPAAFYSASLYIGHSQACHCCGIHSQHTSLLIAVQLNNYRSPLTSDQCDDHRLVCSLWRVVRHPYLWNLMNRKETQGKPLLPRDQAPRSTKDGATPHIIRCEGFRTTSMRKRPS